jgi:hypothetical protein
MGGRGHERGKGVDLWGGGRNTGAILGPCQKCLKNIENIRFLAIVFTKLVKYRCGNQSWSDVRIRRPSCEI